VVRSRVEEVVFKQIERTLIGPAQPLAGLHDLVEDRSEPRGADDSTKDGADRSLLLAGIFEPPGELGLRHDAGHAPSLGICDVDGRRGAVPHTGSLSCPANH
jgi:hypothetical protein